MILICLYTDFDFQSHNLIVLSCTETAAYSDIRELLNTLNGRWRIMISLWPAGILKTLCDVMTNFNEHRLSTIYQFTIYENCAPTFI
jgi:hypothetical protein